MMKHNRYYLNHDEFRFIRQFLQNREIYFISGTSSLYVPSRKEKYLLYSRPDGYRICRDWTDENGQTYEMTPGEAARAELKKAFPGLRRVGWMADHIKLFDWRWPMLYTGPFQGHATYIDLKGAYWQLYKRLWLDTAFPCGYGTLSLSGIAENLKLWKGARNALIGVCSSRGALGVKGYKSVKLTTNNPYLSPGLWATIQACLNELAFEAQCLGSIYIATDGYIFPDTERAQRFEEYLLNLGLNFRSSYGHAEIKTWGAYKVKGKTTETFKLNGLGVARPFCSIKLPNARYPDHTIRWWSKSIPHYAYGKYYHGGLKECQTN